MEDNFNLNIYESFDNLLIKKNKEIELIYNNKNNNTSNINNNNSDVLSYDVKKILAKQKTHDLKRKENSKNYKKEQVNNLMNYITSIN